jgi:peptidoglycan/LPS O-acetylase OafA/YrhL
MGLIRFILAVSVLIVHSSPIFGLTIVPGSVAVHSFYIISGFYMAMIYNGKYSKSTRPVADFYVNRLLRLYPLYITVVVLIVVLGIVYGMWLGSWGKLDYYADWYAKEPDSFWSLLIIGISNLTLIGQDVITFFGLKESGQLYFLGLGSDIQLQELLMIPIAWTVSVEILFYLTTPFLAQRKVYTILLAILFTLILRAILYQFFDVGGGFSLYRFAPTELFWFLSGLLSYRLRLTERLPSINGAFLLIIWVCVLILYSFFEYEWLVYTITFLFTPFVFQRFSRSTVDRYLGELAYPIYLGHMLFILIVYANSFPKDFGLGLPLFMMTLAFAVVACELVLKPIDRMRSKRIHPTQ